MQITFQPAFQKARLPKKAVSASQVQAKRAHTGVTPRFGGANFEDQLDKPALDFKPDPKPRLLSAIYQINHNYILRNVMNIRHYKYQGLGRLKQYLDAGYRVMLAPNHPGFGDVYLVVQLGRHIKRPVVGMGTVAIFTSKPHLSKPGRKQQLGQKLLTSIGLFPVHTDEMMDMRAVKTAQNVLKQGKYPLVVFPEGFLSYSNDRIADLQDGTAYISLSVAEDLADQGQKVAIFPVGIKHHYVRDVYPALNRSVSRLENHLGLPAPYHPASSVKELLPRLEAVWNRVIDKAASAHLGYAIAPGSVGQRHKQLLEGLVAPIENDLKLEPTPGTSYAKRIIQVRQKLRRRLKDNLPPEEQDKYLNHFRPKLQRAFELQKLDWDYLQGNPRPERLMETLYKLEVEVFGQSSLITAVPRHSLVTIDEPFLMDDYLPGYQSGNKATRRKTMQQLTQNLHGRLQELMDKT